MHVWETSQKMAVKASWEPLPFPLTPSSLIVILLQFSPREIEPESKIAWLKQFQASLQLWTSSVFNQDPLTNSMNILEALQQLCTTPLDDWGEGASLDRNPWARTYWLYGWREGDEVDDLHSLSHDSEQIISSTITTKPVWSKDSETAPFKKQKPAGRAWGGGKRCVCSWHRLNAVWLRISQTSPAFSCQLPGKSVSVQTWKQFWSIKEEKSALITRT